MSPPLQAEISADDRAHCEIVPYPGTPEIVGIAHSTPDKIVAYINTREVVWNKALGDCELRGNALLSAIDDVNAKLKALAHK